MEFASLPVLQSIVHQGVVNVDHLVFQIHVLPAQSNQFSHSQIGVNHDIKDRIPVSIPQGSLHITEKEFLPFHGQRLSFLHLMPAGNTKFLEHPNSGVLPDVVVVHCKPKRLMEHIVNVGHGGYFQATFVYQGVILAPSFQLLPQLEALVYCHGAGIYPDPFVLINDDLLLHLSQAIQRFGIDGMPLAIPGALSILIFPVGLFCLSGSQSHIQAVNPHTPLNSFCHHPPPSLSKSPIRSMNFSCFFRLNSRSYPFQTTNSQSS